MLPYPPSRCLVATSLVLGLALWAAAPALAGTPQQPEVTDDPAGDGALPPELNLLSGWVGNESSTSFSVFMKVESLAPPPDGTTYNQYHFHFQVTATNDNETLYHAMVHQHTGATWTFMVQRWIPSGGQGTWGDTHTASGWTDGHGGVLEVRVEKGWLGSPKVDIARNGFAIHSFFIHADRVSASTGAIQLTDSAPNTGTMGSYTVSLGAPPSQSSGGSQGAVAVLSVIAAGAALLVVRGRVSPRRGR